MFGSGVDASTGTGNDVATINPVLFDGTWSNDVDGSVSLTVLEDSDGARSNDVDGSVSTD